MRPTRRGLIVSCLLLLACCSGDGATTTTAPTSQPAPTSTPHTASTTTAPPVAGTTEPATTLPPTPSLPPRPTPPLLVMTSAGVVTVAEDGSTHEVLAGHVEAVAEDTMGGLLFQRRTGRSWDEPPGDQTATIIWWVPAGRAEPQELIVPTPGSDQRLSLHDAYAGDDGLSVLYTRHDGSTPFEDVVDHLRRLDVATGAVTEVFSMGAFEQGFGGVTTDGDLVAGTWYGQIISGCFIRDLDGDLVDGVPALADPVTEDHHVAGCRLGPDGTTLTFSVASYDREGTYGGTTIHVWDLATDQELHRIDAGPELGTLGSIDTTGTWLLANRAHHDGWLPALVWSLDDPSAPPSEAAVAGRASLLTSGLQVGTAEPVDLRTGPAHYRYGPEGLARVVDGVATVLEEQSVMWAVDDRNGGVLYRLDPQLDAETTHWLPADGHPRALGDGPVSDPQFAARIDGEQVLAQVVHGDEDVDADLLLWHVAADTTERLVDVGFDGDGWRLPSSFGGGWFVGVQGVAAGCGYSDSGIVVWDRSGRLVDHPTNPVPEPELPVELSASIAPDGRRLAYVLRLDAPSEARGRLECGGRDAWWEATQPIQGRLVVVDLDTGAEVFTADTGPQTYVVDFDGRYVVVSQSRGWYAQPVSIIYDIEGEFESLLVPDGAALVHGTLPGDG